MTDEGPDPRDFLNALAAQQRAQHFTYVADAVSDLVLDRADVVYVFDLFGNKFLDLSAGDGVMVVGHNNPPVITAVTEHLKHHQHTARSGEHVSLRVSEYAEAISKTFPEENGRPQQVLFCASDREAKFQAVDLVRSITGRRDIATISGQQLVTHKVLAEGSVPPAMWWDDTAALALELINTDMSPLDPVWARTLCETAERAGVLVILNEARTGYGRTGSMWCQEQYAIDPAITILGGAGGGGFPFGAVVAGPQYFDLYEHPPRIFGASPVICQAGLSTLEQISGPLLEHVIDCGHVLTDAVTELRHQFPDIISGSQGIGLEQALLCRTEDIAARLFPELLTQGLLLRPPTGRAIPVTPPLVISETELRWAVDLMAAACLDWSDPL